MCSETPALAEETKINPYYEFSRRILELPLLIYCQCHKLKQRGTQVR